MSKGNPKGTNHRLGTKHTQETKGKIRLAHLGTKKPWSAANRKVGVKMSEEAKRKIGDAIRGRKESLETRMKKSVSMKIATAHLKKDTHTPRGEKNKIRKSFEYRNWRTLVFQRDGFKCRMPNCTSDEKYVEANHIKLFSEYPELRFDVSNGITLCKLCHSSIRGEEDKYEELFDSITKTPWL